MAGVIEIVVVVAGVRNWPLSSVFGIVLVQRGRRGKLLSIDDRRRWIIVGRDLHIKS